MLFKFLNFKKSPKNDKLLVVRDFATISKKYQTLINNIYQNSHSSQSAWDNIYLPTITKLSLYLQELPASNNHHHCYKGGFLEHSIDVIDIALKKRNELMLPQGVSVEKQNDKKDIWTFGVFVAAAMHDIGKINSDMIINLYNNNEELLGRWNPWFGDMHALRVCYYDYQFNPNRDYKDHNLIASTMLTSIVPISALDYLKQDSELFKCVLLVINGRYAESGNIGDIIKHADSKSAANSFINNTQQLDTHHKQSASLADKLLSAIRFVVLDKPQAKAINEPGSIALTTKEHIYLFSKRLLDEAREELIKHDQSGIPYNNSRLMDELLDFNIIDKNSNNKAIFDIVVWNGGFKKKQNFTMLRMSINRLFPDPLKAPKPFSGNLKESTEKEPSNNNETEAKQQTKEQAEKQPTQTPKIIADGADEIAFDLPLPPVPNDETEPDNNQQDDQSSSSQDDQSSEQPEDNSNLDQQLKTLAAKKCAQLFLIWLVDNIQKGKLAINNQNASVHVLKEGLFLVSPVIFKMYSEAYWNKVQNGLTSLKIAKKTPYDNNIWKIVIKKQHRHDQVKPAHKISGYLISNYEEKLKLPKLPINNKVELI